MKKHVLIATMAAVIALATCMALMASCAGNAGKGTLNSEFVAETGAYRVIADDAPADHAIGAGGAVTIKDTDVLLISPDLTQGKLTVQLKDAGGAVVFEREVSGRVLDTYEVAAGKYDVNVACNEAGTTGSVLVFGVDAKEFEQQGKDLDKILESMGDK